MSDGGIVLFLFNFTSLRMRQISTDQSDFWTSQSQCLQTPVYRKLCIIDVMSTPFGIGIMLTELHIRHSYSRKGCPYDNATMESFHASLKKECVYPVPVFENYETAATVLFEYVHAFYNRKRIHSSLGYQTPLQVVIATLTSQMAA